MLIEVRGISQITIPAEIVKSMGIKEGDKFEVIEKNGGVFLFPVVVYPKNEMVRIAKLVKKTQGQYRNDELKVYNDIDQMFEGMGIDLDEKNKVE